MTRRDWLARFSGVGAVYLAAPMINLGRCRLNAAERQEYSIRSVDLVSRSVVIDMLGLLTLDYRKLNRWHADPGSFTNSDFEHLRQSGISTFHPAVDLNRADAHNTTLRWLQDWNRLLESRRDWFLPVRQSGATVLAKKQGKIGILLGMQNSDHFRTEADVATFYGLGQRISQLTYNERNRIGSGCVDSANLGLTELGFKVVEEMNRAGMMVDVSHAGDHTCLDAFAASSKPVLITHSNCRAIIPHPRCKSDEVIRGMAKTGGVMGITGLRIFNSRRRDATVQDVLNHFDHIARLVGIEHIGVGSDSALDPRPADVSGLDHSRRIYELTEGLIQRGYTDTHIEQILGLNFQRVIAAHDRAETSPIAA
ncbi:MAG TPA: membrane dipeptidase [Bryobacteraceae bacterium]|nr:membrane dipeptidase [Bryobacteraceae bacterium]